MKILAVDDDEFSLELLKACLNEGGYNDVSLLSSASDALNAIASASTGYDCILLDVEMPEVDGIELCASIRSIIGYQSTPILMITKHKEHAGVARAFANGATDYIAKPFEVFEVLTRIKVAERLVQERQAAVDSYMAMQGTKTQGSGRNLSPNARTSEVSLFPKQFQIDDKRLLSLSVFQNYLEQIAQSDNCEISLFAVKVTNVDRIFAVSDASEFIGFLKSVASVIIQEFAHDETFLAHAGNGTFLCSLAGSHELDTAYEETSLMRGLKRQGLPRACVGTIQPEISVGYPLVLTSTPKLNFSRVVKVATARVDLADRDMGRTGLKALVG